MDDRFIELALDAGLLNYIDHETPRRYFINGHADLKDVAKFAELVVLETRQEAANEIERLREWIRHIGYYVSRNEVDPTPTEKYIQKVCASALKEGE